MTEQAEPKPSGSSSRVELGSVGHVAAAPKWKLFAAREKLARQASVIARLSAEHNEVLAERTVVQAEADRLRSELSALRQRLDEVRLERDSANHRVRRTRAKLEKLRADLTELRGSFYLTGAAKKLDISRLPGFADAASRVLASGRGSMNYDRLYTLWQAVEAAPPDFPIVEIGAYQGGSAAFIVEALQAAGRSPRFYVCDTFSGHPRTDPEIDTHHHGGHKFLDTSAADVAEHLSAYDNVELVVGDILETSARLADEQFGFVHVDVDVHPATDHCLRFFAPRLAPGAVLVLDDYGFVTCPGVKRAADAFVAEFPDFMLFHLLTGQALIARR